MLLLLFKILYNTFLYNSLKFGMNKRSMQCTFSSSERNTYNLDNFVILYFIVTVIFLELKG